MMKYHFSSACGHIVEWVVAGTEKWSWNSRIVPKGVGVHLSGEARARPRDANFLRGAGGSLADLFSVCNGAPPETPRFLETASSFFVTSTS